MSAATRYLYSGKSDGALSRVTFGRRVFRVASRQLFLSGEQREVKIRLGQTGSGKSWGAARLFETLPRAIVAECGYGEFQALRFDEFPDLIAYLDKIGAFANPHVPFRVSYTPRIAEYPLIFETALELRDCWLFLEEADRFGDPLDCEGYDEVLTRGRHSGISICALSLHPFKLPIDLRRQTTSLVSFRQVEPRDISWIRDHVGPLADELPNLPGPPQKPPFPYLEWDGLTGARIIGKAPVAKPVVPETPPVDAA